MPAWKIHGKIGKFGEFDDECRVAHSPACVALIDSIIDVIVAALLLPW